MKPPKHLVLNQKVANRTGISLKQVSSVLSLLEDGATIPFIARYRKEATGGLDEVQIAEIEIEQKKLLELEKRREYILAKLKELNITEPLLLSKIANCDDATLLEDLYLPYKQKRKTRATIAKELGLEPLAKIIMAQQNGNLDQQARRFIQKGLTVETALEGARDIIAEWVCETPSARQKVRNIYKRTAVLTTKVPSKKVEAAQNYKDYFDFSQSLQKMPSHRLLAIFRAEKEGLLKVKMDVDVDNATTTLQHQFIKSRSEAAEQINLAIKDGLKRLLLPALETEMRQEAKEKADDEAIRIFSTNLQQLLLAPPLGAKRVLALDPGFRSGCKLVCLDEHGHLVNYTNIYPHPPQNQTQEAQHVLLDLMHTHRIEAVAIGNGTAGRETEQFVKKILPKNSPIEVYSVNEAGASIYSASEAGRTEFPDLDLTVRGSISIGRRLIDPLAELVKIEPKSIGVGQYQHDVAQDKLRHSLDNTVSFAVNKVGANVNTASAHLLQHIAGLGPKLAQNITEYRHQNGAFKNRKQLLKVKGFGAKSFEQSAGFLRIKDGDNPLDASGVHPESYALVAQMAKKSGSTIQSMIGNEALNNKLVLNDFISNTVGLPTLKDIISELNKPGLDPRGGAKTTQFDDSIKDITDVKVGMVLPGIITNLTKFGAFTDIGIKENGLIHVSQISNTFITDPSELLRLDQEVLVKVMEVDLDRKRIGLSMKEVR